MSTHLNCLCEVRQFQCVLTQHGQGPVVQSIVSLTSSLVVKMLTVLVSTISNSQVFFAEKNVSSFCKCKSFSHLFSKNISVYAILNNQSFNDTLTNDIASFEQLGPDGKKKYHCIFLQDLNQFGYNLFTSPSIGLRHAKVCHWTYADSEGPQSVQSDQGSPCYLTESLDTTECMTGDAKAWMVFCTCAG